MVFSFVDRSSFSVVDLIKFHEFHLVIRFGTVYLKLQFWVLKKGIRNYNMKVFICLSLK